MPPEAGSHPAVSVVVPFFDSERYIAQCIDSLLRQEPVPGSYELILVDNGSRDRSPEIVSRYDGVTLLREEAPGAYCARNAGIRAARAPLIAFTDADCRVAPDWLRSIQQAMAEPDVAIVVGPCRFPSGVSLPLRWLAAYENAKAEYVIRHLTPEHHYAYANNMAVRASVFEEIGLFEEWRRAGDSELVHRLASRRPDLRLAFDRSMRITHLEFRSVGARLRRLLLYTKTNSRISSFRELRLGSRLRVLLNLLSGRSPG